MSLQTAKSSRSLIKAEPLQNVQVVVRCRPFAATEKGKDMVIDVNESSKEVTVYHQFASAGRKISKSYTFDKTFSADCDQKTLYDQAVQPIVEEVLEGFNCTVFAYGQTGTGKTYTMEGIIESIDPASSHCFSTKSLSAGAGVIPRAVAQIFDRLEANRTEATVKVSFLELYNEELFDLLGVGDGMVKGEKLEIRTNAQQIDVVQGAEEVMVKNAAEIFTVLERGSQRRSKAETLLNKQSSRSHSLFILTIHMKETTPEGEEVIKVGKLNLVDLAGSENISRSGAKEQRAREAGNINQSLLTLGRVITALVEGVSFVPYRDSKLTRLLKESLGGKAKTCIIATVAPTAPCLEETCSTLEYAYRAKNIKNKPEVNCKVAGKVLIKELNLEVERLKEALYLTRSQVGGIFVPNHQYDQMTTQIYQQTEQITQLEVEIKNREAQAAELQRLLDSKTQEHEDLQAKHHHTVTRLRHTTERLSEAREGIHQRDYLLNAHQAHEERLVSHADGLTVELGRTAGDLEGALGKIERKTRVEQENRGVVESLVAEAKGMLGSLQGNLEGARREQGQLSETVLSLLGSFMQRKEQEVAAMRGMVEALNAKVEDLAKTSAGALSGHVDASAAQLAQLQSKEHAFLGSMAEEVRRSAAASRQVLAEIEGALSQDQARLTHLVSAHQEAARGLTSLLEKVTEEVEGSVGSALQAAGRVKEGSAQRLAQQERAMEELKRELEAQARREQAELMESLSAMVNGFVTKKLGMVETCLTSIRGGLQEGHQKAGQEVETVTAALVHSQNSFRGGAGRVASQVQSDAAALAAQVDEVSASLAKLSTTGATLAANVTADAESKAAHVQAHGQEVAQAVAGYTEESKAQGAKALAATEERRAAAAEVSSRLDAALAGALQTDAAGVQELRGQEERKQSALEGAVEGQVSLVSSLSVSVRTHLEERYQADEPTGATPRRRTVEVPPRSVLEQIRTPAHEVLLQSFHKRKADTSLSSMEEMDEEATHAELLAPLPPVGGHANAFPTEGRPAIDVSVPRSPPNLLSNGSTGCVSFGSPDGAAAAEGDLTLQENAGALELNSSGGSAGTSGPLADLGAALQNAAEGMSLDSTRSNRGDGGFKGRSLAGSKLRRPSQHKASKVEAAPAALDQENADGMMMD